VHRRATSVGRTVQIGRHARLVKSIALCKCRAVSEHRVIVDWMGERIETLADLFPSELRAVIVGINPAPPSVAAGHYYQGRQGQRFFARLRQAGVLETSKGYEDDAGMAAGIGFTDIVKRPTSNASTLTPAEIREGVRLLSAKLEAVRPPTLIFPFRAAAVELVGRFDGNGWLRPTFAGSRLFVMPGPYEKTASASPTIASLRAGFV
jgi:TDG/mug DNA glycosylase family protein